MPNTAPKKTTPTRKKKKKSRGRRILTALTVVLILVASLFIFYLGRTMWLSYTGTDDDTSGQEVDLTDWLQTAESQNKKVGYYLVGLLGETAESPTEMLSLCCFDKQQKQVHILQLPKATYLGEDDTFKVKSVSEVFANPQDYVWCDTCRCRVYEPEQTAENTHSRCGTALSTQTGSSTVNLVEVFNRQYGLPVDGFYLFEQQTFVKLVDLVGGITVNLAFDVRGEDVTYQKGVRVIDGATALKYVTATDSSVSADIDRMSRFQQVFTAVMQRLFTMSEEKLTADVFQPLMAGSTPLRISVDDTYKTIVQLVRQLSEVSFDSMTAYVVPGAEGKAGGQSYYGVYRAELLALLNDKFNPYGETMAEGDLHITEIGRSGTVNLHETALSAWVLEQNSTAATTTTTAKEG